MSAISSTPYKIFVSHAHADNDLCDLYVAALRERGLDVWYDRSNMQDGQLLSQEIETQLRERNAFVWMITPASLTSYWVSLEVGASRNLVAQDHSRLFLPVRIANCEMPVLVADIKWIDAFRNGFDTAVNELIATLQARAPSVSSSVPFINVAPHPDSTAIGVSAHNTLSVSDVFSTVGLFLGGGWGENALRAAMWLDPNNAQAKAFKSIKLTEQGRYAEALVELERSLVLDPEFAFAWALKGEALRDLQRHAEAVAAFDRTLALDMQKNLPVWVTRSAAENLRVGVWASKALSLHELGRHVEEVAAYDQALAFDPADVGLWERKSKALRELGRNDEADMAIEQAFRLRSKTNKK